MKTFDIIQERVENWDLLKMEKDAQKGYLKNTLMSKILQNLMNNDFVVQIILPDVLEAVVQEVFGEVTQTDLLELLKVSLLNEDPSSKDVIDGYLNSPEIIAKVNFVLSALPNIKIKSEPVNNMAVEGMDKLTHINNDDFFIRLLTQSYLENQYIAKWDRELGFSESLEGTYVTFSQGEMKILFGLSKVFEILARRQHQTAKVVTPNSVRGQSSYQQ